MPSMYQGVPYIAFQRGNESSDMEGQESSESDPCQGKLQKDLDYVHILVYVVLGVKPAYIRNYGFKSRVY